MPDSLGTTTDAPGRALRIGTLCLAGALGGMELSMLRHGAELIARGHFVIAFLPDSAELHRHADRLGIPSETIVAALPYLDPLAARTIRSLVKRHALDLLIVGRSRDLSTAIIGAGRSVAVVYFCQMQSGIDKRDWFHDRIYRRLDRAITITAQGRRQLTENTILPAERIDLIPYGIDADRFENGPAPDIARREFGLSVDAFVVGIIGGFNPGKGQREFLRALVRAAEMEPELAGRLHGLLVGYRSTDDEEYKRALNSLRYGSPFPDRIHFFPFQDDPRDAFRALDIFVLASYSETFGIVLQEAMASGVPVIGTASGGVGEIITDGETGLLVPPRDAEAIAHAIVKLYRDNNLRTTLATRGKEFVRKTYNLDATTQAFERSLYSAVDERTRRLAMKQ